MRGQTHAGEWGGGASTSTAVGFLQGWLCGTRVTYDTTKFHFNASKSTLPPQNLQVKVEKN